MDKLKFIKDKLEESAYEEVHHNLERLNICELGEVIDAIKDISETMYYCKVVEAMNESTPAEIKEKMAQHATPHTTPPL